jgi:hypothetical protein
VFPENVNPRNKAVVWAFGLIFERGMNANEGENQLALMSDFGL